MNPDPATQLAATFDVLQQQLRALPEAQQASLRSELNGFERCLHELLQHSEAIHTRYRSLLDAAPEAITVLDMQGRVLDANRTACQMYGYSLEQLRQLNVHDLNPDLPQSHMQVFGELQTDGEVQQVECTNRTQDGRRFPVEVRSSIFMEASERRVVALARDLSARHAAEAELKASEQRYRDLLSMIDKGVVIQDRELRLVSMNAAARRILDLPGHNTDAALGPPDWGDWQLLDEHGHALPEERWPHRLAVQQRRPLDSRVYGLLNSVSLRLIWISLTVQPQFHDDEHEPFQLISVFSDVTELKRAGELFAEAQRLTQAGGFEVDVPNGLIYFTEELYRICGRDPNWAIDLEQLPELIHPADRERAREGVRGLTREERTMQMELRVLGAPASGLTWIRVLARSHIREGRLLRISGVVQEITASKQDEDRLKHQAEHDTLTGLSNREAFFNALRNAIDLAEPGHGPAILYVDLDRFKVLNDLLGHAAGDRLLRACAQRLRQSAPNSSQVGRVGADEFVVMLPEIGSDDLLWQVAERITRAFNRPFTDQGEEFLITASIGLARFPEDGGNAEQLLHHADAAMFEAKRRGRNGWQSFSPALAAQLKERLLIETQLRRALEAGEFRIVYQPKVHLPSGRISGAEALLRWHNRSLGELPPDVFIPHAETTGDIVQIGAWVLRQSCAQLALWRRRGLKLDHIAVNISYRQFLSERFERDVADALLDEGLDGSSLELEITERALIEDSPEVRSTIENLRKLGVRLSIDDFGEGYSALGYLRRLPIHGLKISHHFMQGIPSSSTDTRLCEIIVQMARALGLRVVAEGVETETQRQFLLRQGAEFAQGYLFARPLEVDDFERFVRQ